MQAAGEEFCMTKANLRIVVVTSTTALYKYVCLIHAQILCTSFTKGFVVFLLLFFLPSGNELNCAMQLYHN